MDETVQNENATKARKKARKKASAISPEAIAALIKALSKASTQPPPSSAKKNTLDEAAPYIEDLVSKGWSMPEITVVVNEAHRDLRDIPTARLSSARARYRNRAASPNETPISQAA